MVKCSYEDGSSNLGTFKISRDPIHACNPSSEEGRDREKPCLKELGRE